MNSSIILNTGVLADIINFFCYGWLNEIYYMMGYAKGFALLFAPITIALHYINITLWILAESFQGGWFSSTHVIMIALFAPVIILRHKYRMKTVNAEHRWQVVNPVSKKYRYTTRFVTLIWLIFPALFVVYYVFSKVVPILLAIYIWFPFLIIRKVIRILFTDIGTKVNNNPNEANA